MYTQVAQNTGHSGGWRSTIAYGLSLLFVCLFLYTVYHKAVGMDAFERSVARIPYLGGQAGTLAWSVLAAEVLVSLLIIWPDTNRIGLWGALGLMSAFTLYIASMLLFAKSLPCHCGGAIEKLTWQQHLLFNCGFIALAVGLLLYDYRVNLKQLILKAMATIAAKAKKAAFGMTVAALALGFSAFTNQNEEMPQGTKYWGNAGNGIYRVISGTPDFDNCEEPETNDCVLLSVNSEGIPDEFTVAEMIENGYDVEAHPSSSEALYSGL